VWKPYLWRLPVVSGVLIPFPYTTLRSAIVASPYFSATSHVTTKDLNAFLWFIHSIPFRLRREAFYEDDVVCLIDMLLCDKYLRDAVSFSSNKHECYPLQCLGDGSALQPQSIINHLLGFGLRVSSTTKSAFVSQAEVKTLTSCTQLRFL